MFIFTFKSLVLIFLSLCLLGCGSQEASMEQICEEQAAICDDLHEMGDCRRERLSLIRLRYNHILEPSEKNTQLLLEELNEYKVCLEPTLHIAYTRYKDRKQKRLDNYLVSQGVIEELLAKSKDTQDPNLAYYLWTNYKDLRAKRVFLNAANQPNLTDVSLLIKLAVYHSSDEPQQSINFYYKALQESKSIEELPQSMFLQLVSFFYTNHLYEETYLWAKITLSTSNEPPPINLDMIIQRGRLSKDVQSKLEKQASDYLSAIKSGTFKEKTPILPIDLEK
jgi:hypothetical protein